MAITLGGTTLPCPKDSTRQYILKKADVETLGGKTRWDVMARKYKYTLRWDFISVTDYDALEDKVNTLVPLTFIWDKYTSTTSPGVSVLASLSDRKPTTAGNQSTGFYSDVTLELIEVDTRL